MDPFLLREGEEKIRNIVQIKSVYNKADRTAVNKPKIEACGMAKSTAAAPLDFEDLVEEEEAVEELESEPEPLVVEL